MSGVRFAVTPSTPLTLAALRVALVNDMLHRQHNRPMTLRLDDLDEERCKPGLADQIMRDLDWFGLRYDAVLRQSERLEVYNAVMQRLRKDGYLYPCFESEEELRAKQEFRRRRNRPLIYDRAMLSLTPAQRQAAEARGKRPHWRLKLSGRKLAWNDLVQGPRHGDLSAVSDPVLIRADGRPAPLLASVIDDLDTGTTHIIRSEDSAGNTAIQMELFEILTRSSMHLRFGHLPVPSVEAGPSPGARRFGSTHVHNLRNDGIEPASLISCLTGGTALSLDDVARRSSPGDFAQAALDPAQMLAVNREVLGRLEFAAVADRLPGGATEAFWRAVRGKVDLLKEVRGWWDVVTGTIVPPVIDGAHEVLAQAAELLPPEPWDHDVWHHWLRRVAEATGQPEQQLEHTARLALTGEDSGPDLADLLPLIGRTRAAARLAIAAA